jgi:hypothetical protein
MLVLCGSFSLVVASPQTFGQQPVTDASLRGTWNVSGSKYSEVFSFLPNNGFTYGYVEKEKRGVSIPSLERVEDGAYSFKPDMCSGGDRKGNLWIAKQSDRCCFNAYFLGKTLVLDRIAEAPPAIGLRSLCTSKTLQRVSASAGAETRQ